MIPNDVFFGFFFVAVNTTIPCSYIIDYVRCASTPFFKIYTLYVFHRNRCTVIIYESSLYTHRTSSITYFIMCNQSNQCHVSYDDNEDAGVIEPYEYTSLLKYRKSN